MNNIKRISLFALIATLFSITALPLTANAEEPSDADIKSIFSDSAFVIRCESDEEIQECIKALELNNAVANQKWQEALNRTDTELVPISNTSEVSMRATNTYSANASISRSWREIINTLYFNGYLNLRGHTITENGATRFADYTGVYLKSDDTKDKVENHTYEVAALDSYRSFMVHSDSFVVLYKDANTSKRYPLSLTVEFYTSGAYTDYK